MGEKKTAPVTEAESGKTKQIVLSEAADACGALRKSACSGYMWYLNRRYRKSAAISLVASAMLGGLLCGILFTVLF